MSQVTRQIANRIAVVFDFDETLTPKDSFAELIREFGFDADAFDAERVQPLIDQGWEKYLARAFCLVKESRRRDDKITKERLAKVGETIELYEGTQYLYGWLERTIKEISDDIELEFYLISGGFVDIARATPLAKDFKRMWGCELQYSEAGDVEFIKRQMTHVEKTRYLYYLSKGVSRSNNEADLVYDYDEVDPADLRIPLDQVVYVGDGASDVPCFAVMKQYGGTSIGIHKADASAEEWEYLESVGRSQRLSNLLPAGFEKDSELVRSLRLAVESIARRILLLRVGDRKWSNSTR